MSGKSFLWLGTVVAGFLLSSGSHAATTITFDKRENVNLLNSDAVVLTSNASSFSATQNLIGEIDQPGFWEGGGASANIAMDLGDTQNVKTIKMYAQFNAAYGMASATVETGTSLSGPWTVVPASVSNQSGDRQTNIVLGSAVNTRYLRVTRGTAAPANTENRWVINGLRVFGETGATLVAGNHQDIISSSAMNAPGFVTITTTGANNVNGASFADDNPSPDMLRKVYWSMTSGASIRVAFNQSIDFDKFGFAPVAFFTDSSASFHFQIWGAQDVPGNNFTTLLYDQTGPEPTSTSFFNLPAFNGTALRLNIVNTSLSDLRIADLFVTVPEPTTASAAVTVFALAWAASPSPFAVRFARGRSQPCEGEAGLPSSSCWW
jgi:hypothetical protein